jgi:hypothetical protein
MLLSLEIGSPERENAGAPGELCSSTAQAEYTQIHKKVKGDVKIDKNIQSRRSSLW